MEGKALYPLFHCQPPRKKAKVEKERHYTTTNNADDKAKERQSDPKSTSSLEYTDVRSRVQTTVPGVSAQTVADAAQSGFAPSVSTPAGDRDQLQQHADSNLPSEVLPGSVGTRKANAAPLTVATGALATLMEAGRTRLSRQRFHLDLREDGTYTSSWQKETLACKGNSVWKAEIKFKDGSGNNEITLTVSTGQPSSTKEQSLCWECPQMLSNIDQERRPKLSASLLKSAVQKNVRLCRSSPAVRASLHLMKDSWSEFLRRATIIALEDAILHPDLPFLVWLTAAVAKGYQPSKLHAAVCLRIVHEMAAVKCCDPLSDADEADTHCPTMSDISQHVSAQEATVLKALLLRASFGGMAGDVRMLRCYVRVWLKRFSGASPPPPPLANFCSGPADVTSPSSDVSLDWGNWLRRLYAQTPRPPQVLDTCTSGALPAVVDVAAMSRIMLSDVPPSAADFHCSNVIEDVLKDTPAGRQVEATCREEAVDAKAVFRSAMWHFRSSKNLKKTLDGETSTDTEDGSQAARIWSALSAEAQKYSLNLIKRRFGVWT